MKLLIIGGTVFVGRALVEAALARGHEVTLFNRGQHNPELFPEVERLRGDRESDLGALRGRQWDAAIDTCGYVPRVVRASAELLAGAVKHYTFISSVSVYPDITAGNLDESSAVGTLEDESVEEVTGETYGPLKALCEQAAERAMPGKVLVIRPGLIVGPYDPTNRFTYWVTRLARGGDVLAPGKPESRVEVIDVRDLAEWNVRMVEAGRTGVYNATGPGGPLTMGQLLEDCRAVSGSDARLIWVDAAFLVAQGATPWTEIPLWIPDSEVLASSAKAVADGLTHRPITTTIRDTLDWAATQPAGGELSAGLSPEREQQFLEAWRTR